MESIVAVLVKLFFFLATMSRQRVFTALEVAEMLQNDEDDDWLFAGRSGPVDTSEEEDDDDTGDVRHSHPPSMEVDSSSDSEDDSSNHYLDADVSAARLAEEFIDLHVDSRGTSADQQFAGTQPGDQVQVRCGCSQECLKKVEWEAVEANRFTMQELEKGEKDVLVLALMNSGMFAEETNARNKKRKNRVGFQYTFEGQVVCAGAFRFIYHLGSREFRNLQLHLRKHGVTPRVHGNTGRKPHNALTFAEVENCASFIKRFAEIHGLPQPSPLRGRDDQPPIYLPASFTYKRVHELYTESCGQFVRAVKLSSFCAIWHQCFPHIQFMTPRTDVCDRCEKHRLKVNDAVTEEEKTAALAAFTAHLHNAKMERDKYKQCTEDAKKELEEADQLTAPPYAPCSNDLRKSNYTFDFAQQVLLPHTARQVGPINFKTPRKVQLFGVCTEGIPNTLGADEPKIGN